CHGSSGKRTAGAYGVLNDQRLPIGQLLEAVRKVARQGVGRPARADRHQQANRSLGPLRRGLSEGGPGGCNGNRKCRHSDEPRICRNGKWHGSSLRKGKTSLGTLVGRSSGYKRASRAIESTGCRLGISKSALSKRLEETICLMLQLEALQLRSANRRAGRDVQSTSTAALPSGESPLAPHHGNG